MIHLSLTLQESTSPFPWPSKPVARSGRRSHAPGSFWFKESTSALGVELVFVEDGGPVPGGRRAQCVGALDWGLEELVGLRLLGTKWFISGM